MFLQYNMRYLVVSTEKNPLFVSEDVIEKSIPHDDPLSSFGKPCDVNWWSLGQIFLSHPHTHDGFLNLTLIASITTATDDKFWDIFPDFRKK